MLVRGFDFMLAEAVEVTFVSSTGFLATGSAGFSVSWAALSFASSASRARRKVAIDMARY